MSHSRLQVARVITRWTVPIDDADPPTTVQITCYPADRESAVRWIARLMRNRMIPVGKTEETK